MKKINCTLALILVLTTTLAGFGWPWPAQAQQPDTGYLEAIRRTAEMVWDGTAQELAATYGLNVVNVTWEDTGRYYNSCVGPNISDMTIQVQVQDPETGQYHLTLMPVIRYPNFSDLTADISPDDLTLLVGNEHGRPLHRVTLTEYLGNIREYLSDPSSWTGEAASLLAERDTHVLVSAQAAFLPIPAEGQATFNPVLFNYQSYAGDPAVLVIVATREGTSATIIDNARDGFEYGWSWGQRLFYNQAGERASFTGQRLSDFSANGGTADGPAVTAAGESGLNLNLNMVLLIQVPLKQKNPMTSYEGIVETAAPVATGRSDIEAAVIGHGPVEGPFAEIAGLPIERDERFPIRVTVQFYKATSNGLVSAGDMEEIAGQIKRVYEEADYVGSLVTSGGSDRPTEYDGSKVEPAGWWAAFWQRFEEHIGLSRGQALDLLHNLGAYAGHRCSRPY